MRAILDALDPMAFAGRLHPLTHGPRPLDDAQPFGQALAATRPDALLASLLSLEGAVNVGDMLERVGDLESAPPDAQQLLTHRQIMLTLTKRRYTIGKRIEQRYAQAFGGVRPVPAAGPIFNLLSDSGVLESRKPKLLAECAQKIADRYQFLFSSTLGVIRKELYWLREDALKALQRVSPRAKRMVMLDSVLDSAVEQAALRAHRSLEAGVAQRFAQQLIEAILALPGSDALPSVESWFNRRGFVTRLMHDCKRLTWAILDSEWSRLRGLCDSCCATCAADNPLPPQSLRAAGIPAGPAANGSHSAGAAISNEVATDVAPLQAQQHEGLAP